jgi:phosphoglycolate phosphatase
MIYQPSESDINMPSIQCLDRTFHSIEAIIFDKDGTLENSGDYLRALAYKRSRIIDAQIPGVGEPLLMAFGVNGDKLDPAGLQAIGSRQENTIAAAAYIAETGRGWAESVEIAQNCFQEADRAMAIAPGSLFPGVLEQLQFLAHRGVKLGIVSAATTSSVVKFARDHHLTELFRSLLGSDGRFAKPDPRLFALACQELDTATDRALMVGDAVWDMVMAKQAGAAGCIGINWRRDRATLAGSDVTIASLEAIELL